MGTEGTGKGYFGGQRRLFGAVMEVMGKGHPSWGQGKAVPGRQRGPVEANLVGMEGTHKAILGGQRDW